MVLQVCSVSSSKLTIKVLMHYLQAGFFKIVSLIFKIAGCTIIAPRVANGNSFKKLMKVHIKISYTNSSKGFRT